MGQNLTFRAPDFEKFPCLKMAYEAGKLGGTAPVVLNAANEVCVYKFLEGKIGIKDIIKTVEAELENHKLIKTPHLMKFFEVDREIRGRLK